MIFNLMPLRPLKLAKVITEVNILSSRLVWFSIDASNKKSERQKKFINCTERRKKVNQKK